MNFTKKCLEDVQNFEALDKVTQADAQKYISDIGQSQSISTRNKKLLVIKKLYNWAMSAHFCPINPFADIKKIRAVIINSDIHYLSRNERELVLNKALSKKLELAFWICLITGMRRGEAFSLRWSDINFETETVIAQSKGGDTRTILLAAPLLKKLLECKKDSGKVVEYKGEYKDASRSIIDTLRRDFKGSIAPRCIGWNPFRHTSCTLLVQSGVSTRQSRYVGRALS